MPQPWPLAAREPPEIAGCDFDDIRLVSHHGTLQPGVCCGGLVITGASDIDLASGLYVIKDGPLAIGDTTEVRGDGVTFHLTGEQALIDFDDGSRLAPSAPASGDLMGIPVFQDRRLGADNADQLLQRLHRQEPPVQVQERCVDRSQPETLPTISARRHARHRGAAGLRPAPSLSLRPGVARSGHDPEDHR